MTTRNEIAAWFDAGAEQGATHMIVFVDTFDFTDYPAYAADPFEARTLVNAPAKSSQVMEVYDLAMDRDTQLAEVRAWHLEEVA